MSEEATTAMMDTATTSSSEVDEKLYSRQLYVMGHEAQRRVMASRVVLVGASGLGVEVAKNCILAGVSSLTLVDPTPVSSFDLGGNFYLSQHQVGMAHKASLIQSSLSLLNPQVKVDVATTVPDLSTESLLSLLLNENQATTTALVVSVPLSDKTLIALNEECRKQSCCFIYATVAGVFGRVFCDFGDAFVVSDTNGNPPSTSQVESIFPGDPLVVKVLEDAGRHGLETGDCVSFSRLEGGMQFLQEEGIHKIKKVTGPYTFELEHDGVSNEETPATQGYITQVKQPTTLSFRSYKEALENPGDMLLYDFAKMDRPPLLHLAFCALQQYADQHGGTLPTPGHAQEAQAVLDLCKSMDKEKLVSTPLAERLVLQLASGSRAILSPMCAALGGIVGQEVLKACSGKFTPISGFFYFDAAECLPEQALLPPDEVAPTLTSRYDSQIACFGKAAQEALMDQNYFLVGAGAIGCEMLKNWALMGVACGPKGHVHVTDMDRIEKSNLSRQFLFRNSDISQFKSTTACRAVQEMNPSFQVTPYQEKVAPETEHLFGDDFYDKLTGVCTALDNVEARLYVDQRCLFYRLPMLESGTLGTKGNTQVVVPHLTENYGATRDPPEKSIPVCTLKNFPNQIQHTLQWARDYFEGEFKQGPEQVNLYLSTPSDVYAQNLEPNSKVETLRTIRRTLVDERPVTFDDCLAWARIKFETLFHNQIAQLLYNFPQDQVTSSGTKFWSGSKRCPKALDFDLDHACDDAHMRNHLDFIVAAANLRAAVYGIKGRTDEPYVRSVLKNVIVPDFTPTDGVKIAANDAEEEESKNNNSMGGDDLDTEADDLWNSLPKPGELAGLRLEPVEFDKDVDEHMLFVTACSNLRALNYSIPTEDTHRSRAIAGRIIPAIATTTALVTGLICLELYKIVGTARRKLPLEAYKNAFLNLAIPFFTLSEPQPPATTKAMLQGKEWNWTAWDSLDMNEGDITMGEFMEIFKKKYRLEISMLSYGVSILYSFFANKKKVEERKRMKMSEVISSITKKEFPPNQLFIILEVIANDLDDPDEEVELPYVKFRFR